jgi:starch phosphorylase
MHSDLIRKQLFRDFDEFFPWRFCSTTNGVTPRRWLLIANPGLANLITDAIGDGWVRDLEQLEALTDRDTDPSFVQRWADVKRQNKLRLADHIRSQVQIDVNVDTLFDCQVKRIHEYKRQLLNVLHLISMYNQIRAGDSTLVPRTVVIAGKAAPGYSIAALIIKLIHAVADVINHDPRVCDLLKVAFLPNYNVSLAEVIIPAMDLSEQISTAGTEASGTGNMKAMLNGALTIGTLDGANVEIREAVGDENIFMFGKTAEEVSGLLASGYDPYQPLQDDAALGQVIEMIRGGFFSSGDRTTFEPLLDSILRDGDRYMVMGDFTDYAACQRSASQTYLDPTKWMRKSITNVAHAGRFSSDHTVKTYADQIWAKPPLHQA